MYHSLAVLSARLTWPTALFAGVVDVQVVDKVPLEKSEPAANQNWADKLLPLSLSNVPVVSASKVIVFFSQVDALFIVYDFEICLELSASYNSKIYVPVLLI